VPRPHSAVGLAPHPLATIARDSRRTPDAKILRLCHTEGENRLTALFERPNHRRASTSRLDTAILERMNIKIPSFMHSVG